ncbi:MAG: hypothetical protein ABJG88_00010 [Litorimonas sp.]
MDYSDKSTADSWQIKTARFVRYIATRHPEVWGFFAAGFLVAKIV